MCIRDRQRIPLKVVHINKAPVVTTHKLIDTAAAKRLNINVEQCEEHWRRLNQVDLRDKLHAVFAERTFAKKPEAEQQLYDGFLPNNDRYLLDEVRNTTSEGFKKQQFHFSDERYNQLLFSYRARYFPDSLSVAEKAVWLETCRWRLHDEGSGYLTVNALLAEVEQLLAAGDLSLQKATILDALKHWTLQVDSEFSLSN